MGKKLDEKVEAREKKMHNETFVLHFYADLAKMKGLSHTAILLFQQLALRCDYDNEFLSNKHLKEKLCNLLDIKSLSSYDVFISQFKKKNLIIKISAGTYRVNPNYFAKGTLEKIRQQREEFEELTLTKTYNKDHPDGKLTINVKTKKKTKSTQSTKKQNQKTIVNKQPINKQQIAPKPSHDDHITAIYKIIDESIATIDDKLDLHIQSLIQTFTHNKNIDNLDYGAMYRYIKKSVDKYLMDKNKTKYKSTKESLEDYGWATQSN